MSDGYTFGYEKFRLSCLSESRPNLITRANEIAVKKYFFQELREKKDLQCFRDYLDRSPDVADYFYLFWQANYDEQWEELCQRAMTDFMEKEQAAEKVQVGYG